MGARMSLVEEICEALTGKKLSALASDYDSNSYSKIYIYEDVDFDNTGRAIKDTVSYDTQPKNVYLNDIMQLILNHRALKSANDANDLQLNKDTSKKTEVREELNESDEEKGSREECSVFFSNC